VQIPGQNTGIQWPLALFQPFELIGGARTKGTEQTHTWVEVGDPRLIMMEKGKNILAMTIPEPPEHMKFFGVGSQ
jgi:hypothetical protein